MRKIVSLFFLLLGSAMLSQVAIAVDIECPDAQVCFKCSTTRAAKTLIKFKFNMAQAQGRNWTPIVMYARTSVPIADTDKAAPGLDVVPPIQLFKDTSGDWTIYCTYEDSGKYGGHVGDTPSTTLTIKANEAETCFVKNEKTVTCN